MNPKKNEDTVGKVIYPEKLSRFLGSGFVSYEQLMLMSNSDRNGVGPLVRAMISARRLEPWVAVACLTCKHMAPVSRSIEDTEPEFECLLCGEVTPVEYLEFYRVFKVLDP